MYLYIFESKLFPNQTKKVITSFPVRNRELLESIANEDNKYDNDKKWILVKIVS